MYQMHCILPNFRSNTRYDSHHWERESTLPLNSSYKRHFRYLSAGHCFCLIKFYSSYLLDLHSGSCIRRGWEHQQCATAHRPVVGTGVRNTRKNARILNHSLKRAMRLMNVCGRVYYVRQRPLGGVYRHWNGGGSVNMTTKYPIILPKNAVRIQSCVVALLEHLAHGFGLG